MIPIKTFRTLEIVMFLLTICTSHIAYANVCDEGRDAATDKQWVVSNLCYFDNTALIKVKTGILDGRYNPLTYFKQQGFYTYDIKVMETIKGNVSPNVSCLIHGSETLRFSTLELSGNRLISFNNANEGCIIADVAVYPIATPELMNYAKKVAIQVN